MNILSVGPFPKERNNTSCHRSDWLRTHADYFKELDSTQPMTLRWKVIYHLGMHGVRFNLPDISHINERIKEEIDSHEYDMVWIDKGNSILPSTLLYVKAKQPKCKLVHYMIDDFMNPYHKTKQILDTIPLYDYYIVNRKANIQELKDRGCKNPKLCYMSYESTFHHPYEVTPSEAELLGGEVGFIGTYEKERAESLKYLADNGITVKIFGGGWKGLSNYSPNLLIEGRGLFTEDFCKAIQSFKINLGFLRKKSRDLHTTRSFEIPACGGFMLAERTVEHCELFEEGKEAAFFSSDEEMLQKVRYYLQHDDERQRIAKAGYERCVRSGYSNEHSIADLLRRIEADT